MKRRPFLIIVGAALACLAASSSARASDKEDADSLERLRSEIEHRLPDGWTVTINPSLRQWQHDNDGLTAARPAPAIAVSSKEKLPIEMHAANPAAGEKPKTELRQVEIVLAVQPFLAPDQYERLRATNGERVKLRTDFESKLKKAIRWGFMGPEPIPPSAFDPGNDRERHRLLEYALLWNRTQPDLLPTHYFETVSFDVRKPLLYSRITEPTKAKEYEQIMKLLDGFLKPYQKQNQPAD